MRINITEEVSSTTDLINLLKHIAKLIDEGYTSGYYPHWSIEKTEDESERQSKIEHIKKVLRTWGMTSTAELELSSSPVYNNSALVEEFTEDNVRVITYDDELGIDEDNVLYEDLSDDLIDEIYEIIDQYDVKQNKLHDSCKDENW